MLAKTSNAMGMLRHITSWMLLYIYNNRLKEYFTRELRTLRKRSFEHMFLSRGIGLLDQRPRRPQTLISKCNKMMRSFDENLL